MATPIKSKPLFLTTTEVVVKEIEGSSTLKIEGYANTTSTDRSGDIILEDAWKGSALVNYLKNPIVLAYHDHRRPIGKTVDYFVDSGGLKIVAEISEAAGDVYRLIKEGILKAFSVGFRVKEADYDRATDLFVIKEVELYEISVVSVPCNQDSVFEVSKSFENANEYAEFKEQFVTKSAPEPKNTKTSEEIYKMDPQEIQDLIAKALATQKAEEDKLREEKAKAEAEKGRIAALLTSEAEKLAEKLKSEFKVDQDAFSKTIAELQTTIAEKAEEMEQLSKSMRSGQFNFSDRDSANKSSITDEEIEKAVLISKLTNRPLSDTKAGKALLEKAVNESSSIENSSDKFEQIVSTNIERDLQPLLVIKPLFREIIMSSATQVLPINPNATTAGWVPVAQVSGSARNATTTGSELTKTLTEVILKTYKLAGKTFITDETEEDSIMPLLPLIREGLVEAHALAIDNTFLKGAVSADSPTGLITRAAAASTAVLTTATHTNTVKVNGKMLLSARRAMGQWGLDIRNLKVIVSMEAYWDLLEDDNFANLNEVGAQATKLTGQVGSIYGMPVIVSTQFPTPAASTAFATIVNTKNFLVPRLRGMTVQSEYQTEEQRRVLVATQRLGLNDIISGKGVATLTYAA